MSKKSFFKFKKCRALSLNIWSLNRLRRRSKFRKAPLKPYSFTSFHRSRKIIKLHYGGLSERYFRKASNTFYKKGGFGRLIRKLELRLDSTMVRAGLVKSIFYAQQMISHKHVYVNDALCDRKGKFLEMGDTVYVRNLPRKNYVSKNSWIDLDPLSCRYSIVSTPKIAK